jgi:hypothetical protein
MKLGECTESDFEAPNIRKAPAAALVTPPVIAEPREAKPPAATARAKSQRVRVRSRHVRV